MDNEIDFDYHDLLKSPPSHEELNKLAAIGKGSLKDLINLRSQVFKKMGVDLEAIDEKNLVDLIQANPRILIRPLLTDGNELLLGFKEGDYRGLFQA